MCEPRCHSVLRIGCGFSLVRDACSISTGKGWTFWISFFVFLFLACAATGLQLSVRFKMVMVQEYGLADWGKLRRSLHLEVWIDGAQQRNMRKSWRCKCMQKLQWIWTKMKLLLSVEYVCRICNLGKKHIDTWSFELSLISAHLEKNWLLGVFSRSGRLCFLLFIFRKNGCLFSSNWHLFPSNGRLFPSHARKWACFFEGGVFFLKNEVGRN